MKTLGDPTYKSIANLMHATIGLSFTDSKKALVASRLSTRMQQLGLKSFDDYYALIYGGPDDEEFQVAVDLLTTNETYFFRERRHFNLLEEELRHSRPQRLKVWSAASSYGDEAYSTAMLLSDLQRQGCIGQDWSILGTDISDRVLQGAVEAIYPETRLREVSDEHLKRYCLRGEGEAQGLVQINDSIKSHVRFGQLNLCQDIEPLGPFDVIFLRNVLIYFDNQTKRQVIDRVLSQLRVGGLFFIGMAEGRIQCDTPMQSLEPGAFRKLAAKSGQA
ncbi:MAG: SAM-dependent methyltransferase [Aquabacterium sp.]|uniref:CheR family methyltransferase n=1 Tax=Aquabacterium sp. TaxID=1872578 RepID=UPI00121EF9F6|nr:CheR family methyltransferase [Aquabacterium sp.]TAK97680.1 MAG: SAM-dependent methyltransferase [Aquabacterium sp.]